MLTSMATFDLSDLANVMKSTSGSMKKHIPAMVSGVLKVVAKATAMKNHIDALMLALTDWPSSGKKKLTSTARLDQSENACAMTITSTLIKNQRVAKIAGVLKAVDITTAMRNQNYALNGVHTDSDSIMKQMLRSMASIDQLELADAMTHTRSLMKKLLPVSTLSALKCVDTTTALEEQIDALNGVSTD